MQLAFVPSLGYAHDEIDPCKAMSMAGDDPESHTGALSEFVQLVNSVRRGLVDAA
jgi:hypothetical protein